MVIFIKKLTAFSIPIWLFVLGTIIFYYFSKQQSFANKNLPHTYNCILMGDSQIQRLNGNLICKSSRNVASSGEHYYFTYQKLRALLKAKNQKIQRVLLGVSVHNFAPIYNRMFDINRPEGQKSLEQYVYFIDPFDDSNFLKSNQQLLKPKTVSKVYEKPNWGGFKESNYSNPSKEVINKTFDMHFETMDTDEKFCFSQQKYLYKIDSLCTQNDIELILISTPYHQAYYKKIEANYFSFFNNTLKKLKHRRHFNFLEDRVDSKWMSDANHLNKTGATYYSQLIKDKIENLSDK